MTVVRGALWVSAAAVMGWLGWMSPLSPHALAEAHRLVQQERGSAALVHLDRVARWNPWRDTRINAATMSAQLLLIEEEAPSLARTRLTGVAEVEQLSAEERAAVMASLGHAILDAGGDRAEASSAFLAAYDAARDAAGASLHLVAAAQALEAADEVDRAYQVWERLARRHRDARPRARVAQASILLGRGKVTSARRRYEEAVSLIAPDDPLYTVARLGVATCLEREGMLQEAITEMSESGVSPAVLSPRTEALEERVKGE
ncbi:MAG: hypothetical protein ACON5B_17985 [Myxococcota bacterium]